jgi:hypothetical protein
LTGVLYYDKNAIMLANKIGLDVSENHYIEPYYEIRERGN